MAQSGGHSERVTTVLSCYRLSQAKTDGSAIPTRYRMWDTWGIERNNYQDAAFPAILEGRIGDGHKISEKVRLGTLDLPPIDGNHVKHCVIFFIPASEARNKNNSEIMNSTARFVQTATEMGIESI